MVHILWVPQTWEQQSSALQRMHSLDGKPYDLFVASCEHVVNWAVTGKSYSEQLGLAAVSRGGVNCRSLSCQRARLRKKFQPWSTLRLGLSILGLLLRS